MRRRIGAFLVVLVIGTAPAALTACEFMCARQAQSAPDLVAHSCHTAQHSDAPAVSNGVHICGHESEMPAGAKTTLSPPYVPVIDVASFWSMAGSNRALPRLDTLVLSPPGPPTLQTPLRI